jgi:uncharacterized membrane-anchored protein YhcB (DUF1043 family)
MNYTPSATSRTTEPKNNKGLIALLIGIIIGMLGYIIYDKIQDNKVQESVVKKDVLIGDLDSAKQQLQVLFDEASVRIDSISTSNVQLQGALADKNAEIVKMKQDIGSILKNKNATKAELQQAQSMIAQLNGKIDDLFVEVEKLKAENAKLTGENAQLTTDKNQLTTDKQNLESNLNAKEAENKDLANSVDIASTLHASNIGIAAIKMRGDKEIATETAKRANFFRIAFNLDENRVAKAGSKTLYIVVKNPDGSTSAADGNFKLRDGSDLRYTNKVEVNYEPNRKTPVSFDWKPGDQIVPGDYKIEIYNNGFKIGEAVKTMKKGGLFS